MFKAPVADRWRLGAALALLVLSGAAAAQDPVNGKLLYRAKLCEACHQADVSRNVDGILRAVDPNRTLSECARQRDMAPLCGTGKAFAVSRAEAVDIAAFVANPKAGDAAAPLLVLSATSLDFAAALSAGASARQTVTLTNSGGAAVALTAVALSGAQAAEFTLLAPASGTRCQAGVSLAAKAACSVDLSFDPVAVGSRKATLSFTPQAASGLAVLNVALNGSASADVVPVAQADAARLDFGSQTVAVAATAKTLTLRNAGGANLTLAATGALTLGGAAAADYAIGADGTCQAATTLAPTATCTVRIGFKPAATGARAASLTIKSNASDLVIALEGVGVGAGEPLAEADRTALDFGSQTQGVASATLPVVITNRGGADLVFDATTAFLLSGAALGDFSLDASSTCSTASPVAAGASCTLQLRFTPGAAGSRTATLSVASNAAATVSVALSGTGVAVAGDAAAADNAGGGCSLLNPRAGFDPLLLLMAGGALAIAWRRRARPLAQRA